MASLFNNEDERQLWIRLNAQRIQWFQKHVNKIDYQFEDVGPHRESSCMGISLNQLEFDEKEGKLRFSLEELSSLSYEQLYEMQMAAHREWCRTTFGTMGYNY